jgi:hypothetical protein
MIYINAKKNIPEDALKEQIDVYWVDDIQRYIWVK